MTDERRYRVQAKDLDTTTIGGATRLEMEYAAERAHLPLKAKYRPKRGSHAQWSTGGDYGSRKIGKTDNPGTLKVKRKPRPPRKMVLAIGPTGKRTMIEEE